MGVFSARMALALCLFACSPTTPPPARPAAAEAPPATPAVAPGNDPLAVRGDRAAAPGDGEPSARTAGERQPARFPSGSLALNNTWTDCVKDFVDGQRALAREPLIDALSVYFTTCDRVERRIVVEAPRPTPSGHDYAFESHISFGAHLTRAQQRVWISVTYHGDTRIMAERIKVAADDFRWASPPLTFERDANNPAWESAEMPYTRPLQAILRKMVDAKEVIVRFEGPKTHADLIVTDEMKQDLRLMMDALAAIRIP